MSGANLSGTNLSEANLSGANLSHTILAGTNFFGADMSGSKLSNTDLSAANFQDTNLLGADFSGSKVGISIFKASNLSGSIYDIDTILPNQLDIDSYRLVKTENTTDTLNSLVPSTEPELIELLKADSNVRSYRISSYSNNAVIIDGKTMPIPVTVPEPASSFLELLALGCAFLVYFKKTH